jgi:hypothetical protein
MGEFIVLLFGLNTLARFKVTERIISSFMVEYYLMVNNNRLDYVQWSRKAVVNLDC